MGKKSNSPLLLKGTMLSKVLQSTKRFESAMLVWRVNHYDQLKYEVLYCHKYKNKTFDCILKLFIRRNHRLYVAARCNYTKADAMFYIYNGPNHPSTKEVEAKEIDDGLYVAEFIDNFLIFNDGICKETGLLTICFRIQTSCTVETRYNPHGELGTLLDMDDLCQDIQETYLDAKAPDFAIKVADARIRTHKCVLYARSEFFKDYFEKDDGIEECAVPEAKAGIMHEVLLYIYSGQLSDMDTKFMVKVLEVAYLLKISSLKDRCLKYFDETDSWESIETVEFFEYEIQE